MYPDNFFQTASLFKALLMNKTIFPPEKSTTFQWFIYWIDILAAIRRAVA
jgi:hypothetical protein